ncbi:MAG: lactate utilization protein C [Hyphomicrobiaceae bacterium]|nr:lactate utilization protein C [Hyphomicrobiaceae bacterium]
MSDAGTGRRATVLNAIRGRLGRGAAMPGRMEAVAERLARQPPHLVPERARQDRVRLKALFADQLRAVSATVVEAAGPAEVPAAIAAYLRSANLPLTVRAGGDPWLEALDWRSEPALTLASGRAQPADEVGLTKAVAGVAETGTLVMASGTDNPVTVNFLPETSIIVLRESDLVGPYEQAFDKVRAKLGRGTMPRTLNLISGPSRTADVGGRLVTGAHGPRRLCVVVVGEPP